MRALSEILLSLEHGITACAYLALRKTVLGTVAFFCRQDLLLMSERLNAFFFRITAKSTFIGFASVFCAGSVGGFCQGVAVLALLIFRIVIFGVFLLVLCLL